MLIVEDDTQIQNTYKRTLFNRFGQSGKIQLIQAYTASEGEDFLLENSDLDLIVLDGSLEHHGSGYELLQRIKEFYNGPILAISGSRDMRQMMMASGGTHECEKNFVPRNILNILDLPLP